MILKLWNFPEIFTVPVADENRACVVSFKVVTGKLGANVL